MEFLQYGWPVAVSLLTSFGVVKLALLKHRRVLSNLQRPILVIGTPGQGMSDQYRLLKGVGLFVLDDLDSGDKALDRIAPKHRLLVVGYSATPEFRKVFQAARDQRKPILVYAKAASVSDDDVHLITGYSYAALCNTDLRLTSDVFAAMSTFPENL